MGGIGDERASIALSLVWIDSLWVSARSRSRVGSGRDGANPTTRGHIMVETEYRIEHDTMGEVRVPKDALYAAQTQRAIENLSNSSAAP